MRQKLLNVVASREVVIWEAAISSPPEDPFHCPPSVVWVHFLDAKGDDRLRLYHPRDRRGAPQKILKADRTIPRGHRIVWV
ncbi:hypothetical protein ACIP98_29420 [Streptomyces sp. NPDC088354]|uniref:hypothetical protein n=1 Tax=Streptomyces sp. NPDC088354 TaxID=3365856 RepID=UPI003830AAC6